MHISWAAGDPAPHFTCSSTNNEQFHFDAAAGRYVVLCFFGSAAIEKNARALDYVTGELRPLFNDEHVSFFGVSIDPADRQRQRVRQMTPGIRYFWDFDMRVSRLYGALSDVESEKNGVITYHSYTLVLDPNLRVLAAISLADLGLHNRQLEEVLRDLPAVDDYAGVELAVPVLVIPRVLEPEICQRLIAAYEERGGEESGSMSEQNGYTVGRIDHRFKRRKDCNIDDPMLRTLLRTRLHRRVVPEIHKAFQFEATVIERFIVACYDAQNSGFFAPHRDNTTKGTAHRRFACTINLNAEDYEGGNLRFPEFGTRTYRAPTGGAVVFSCSLLHEALPVTQGKRYATLPFLYDEAAAKIRTDNLPFLSGEVIDMTQGRLSQGNK